MIRYLFGYYLKSVMTFLFLNPCLTGDSELISFELSDVYLLAQYLSYDPLPLFTHCR